MGSWSSQDKTSACGADDRGFKSHRARHSIYPRSLELEEVVKLQQFELWLRSEGYSPKTIKSSISSLKSLARHSDIDDPDSVKSEIANRQVTSGTKEKLTHIFDRYCRFQRIEWSKPKYTRVEKIPYVPSEKDIDQLIGGMSPRLGTIIQFIKETGCRLGEMWTVKWGDLNSEKNLVVINQPEKGSKPRIIRISPRLVSLILRLPNKTDYIFRVSTKQKCDRILSYFWQKRKEISLKVNNPNLMKINFKSLRHFKATREYYQTKDLLHIQQLLGHKSIRNTLIYTHLVEFEDGDQFVIKVAKTLTDFTEFLSKGFDYVGDFEGMKVLRKRK